MHYASPGSSHPLRYELFVRQLLHVRLAAHFVAHLRNGYKFPAHFRNAFRAATGLNPLAWRKQQSK